MSNKEMTNKEMANKTVVVNMFSGPGSGKSTLAAELYVYMKKRGYKVEFLQEYAKKLVWEKDFDRLNNQQLVSYKYYKTIFAMNGCVDYIILDSSLINGIWYNWNNPDNLSNMEKTEALIYKYYNEFNNINLFINRGNYQYESLGRIQTENESRQIDKELKAIVDRLNIQYQEINIEDGNAITAIMDYLSNSTKSIFRSNSQVEKAVI